MQLTAVAVVLLLAPAAHAGLLARRAALNASTPITEIVELGGVAFKGDNIEYNSCSPFKASQFPTIKVCGASTVVKVFLRNRCEGYYQYVEKVGLCTGATTGDGCQTVTADRWLSAAQSYIVEQCGAGQGQAHEYEGPACKTMEECTALAKEQAEAEKQKKLEDAALKSVGVTRPR